MEWMRTVTPRDWAVLICAGLVGYVLAEVLPSWAWQTFTAVMIVAFVVLSIRRQREGRRIP